MPSAEDDLLQAMARSIGVALRQLYGDDRGFILVVCTDPPGQPGAGRILSNIEREDIRAVMLEAANTWKLVGDRH